MKSLIEIPMYMTTMINNEIADNAKFAREALIAMRRYIAHDWGDLDASDKQMNDDAIQTGADRVVAAYETSCGKIYIVTEVDRSHTTVLFASEY